MNISRNYFIPAALILILYPSSSVLSATKLSYDMGAGYAGNIYADSFSISNFYLLNSISTAYSRPGKIYVNLGYGLSYYEYDSNNILNNLNHVASFSIFDNRINRKFKWSISSSAAIKDYTDGSSTYNNTKMSAGGDLTYYLKPSLQFKSGYRIGYSDYTSYEILRNVEHRARIGSAITFRSKTTVGASVSYGRKLFPNGDSNFDWIGAQIRVTQSIDLRTGLAVIYHHRWSSDKTRPLSSFFVISGVTSYWDPWDGNQFDISLKRILPQGILSKFNLSLWDRVFFYDHTMQNELPWLEGKSGRNDVGWSANLEFRRQFNIDRAYLISIVASLTARYLSSDSNDDFYQYDDQYINGNLKLNIF